MKRFRSVTAMLLLAILLCTAVVPMNAVAATKMKVTSNSLRLRTGPGTGYTIIGRYKKGNVVTVLKTRGKWAYVRTRTGKKGWMSRNFLTKASIPVQAAVESASGTAIVQKRAVIRKGPSTSYPTIRSVPAGKVMRIIGRTGAWYKIRVDGKTGFIYRGLIKITK